jgi:hypothetical protein
MTQVSIDGVMQGNGHASDENRRNGFERGGWARGKGDNETLAFINQTYQRADAFLLGRRTYQLFAGSWGSLTEQDDTTGEDLQMQYLISVIDDKSNPGSTDRQPAISAFNERLIAEGYWVFAGGLADTDAATVIDNRGEQAVFSDGPFVESKEYLAGVWVWEAPDLDVALKLATEASRICDRKIEVRPFQ